MINIEEFFVVDDRVSNYTNDVQVIGKMVTIFKGYQFRFTQNAGKRPTFVFRSKTNERAHRTVFLSKALMNMFNLGEITKAQLWSCNVIKMDIKDDNGKVVAQNAFVLEKPTTGWGDVDKEVWDEFNSDDIA